MNKSPRRSPNLFRRVRRTLSALLMNALVFVPLAAMGTSMSVARAAAAKAPARTPAATTTTTAPGGELKAAVASQTKRSLQPSAFNHSQEIIFDQRNTLLRFFEEQIIDDVLQFYELPPSDRERVRIYGRDEMRAMLYARVMELIKKESPSSDEQDVLDYLAQRIKTRRINAAVQAKNEFDKFKANPCGYKPPAPYKFYPNETECSRSTHPLARLFTPPTYPSFDEFQQFGAVLAYGDLLTPAGQNAARQTALNTAVGVGASLAAVGGTVGGIIGAAIPYSTLVAVTGLSLVNGTTWAAASAAGFSKAAAIFPTITSGAVGSLAIAGPVAIVIAAVTIGAVAGVQYLEIGQIPGKLDEVVANKQNETIVLRDLAAADEGAAEIFGEVVSAALPDPTLPGVPAPLSTDPRLEIRADGQQTFVTIDPTSGQEVTYRDWNNRVRYLRLNKGWMISDSSNDDNYGFYKLRLQIEYRDWDGVDWVAVRSGAQFIITRGDDPSVTKKVREIQYVDGSGMKGNKFTMRIKTEELTVATSAAPTIVNCPVGYLLEGPRAGQAISPTRAVIGTVHQPGTAIDYLVPTVNGNATAQVNGIQIYGLEVNDDFQVVATIETPFTLPPPVTADFTLRVTNSVTGLFTERPFTVKKSAVNKDFNDSIPLLARVGTPYRGDIEPSLDRFDSCVGYSLTVMNGRLPPGLSIQSVYGIDAIVGTPTSGGYHSFFVRRNYNNGETSERPYAIFVDSDITPLPANAVSWWRAEGSAEDFVGGNHGTLVGSVGVGNGGGRVGRGFRFRGGYRSGYVALPSNTFAPNQAFTFELWFSTTQEGTILGMQENGVVPYGQPNGAAKEAIYIDDAGNLKIEMFNSPSGARFVASDMNDGRYHHLAVTNFVSPTTGAQQKAVYVDGELKDVFDDIQLPVNDPRYQLGAGYHTAASQNDGTTDWRNFSGIIDEVTLYGRALAAEEIRSIYASGAAGKILIEASTVPTLSNTGVIVIKAKGGIPVLEYSIDDGQTFQESSTFANLSPGDYQIVVKDGGGHLARKTVTVRYESPGFNVTTESINPTCVGGTNGSIRVNPGLWSYGSRVPLDFPLLYSLDNGATTQSSPVFTNLQAGVTYRPWVRHAESNTVGTGAPVTLVTTPLSISPARFIGSAAVGYSFNQEFKIDNATRPFAVTIGQLPPGLNKATSPDSDIFRIYGTPTQSGEYQIPITISDGNSCPFAQTLTLTVYPGGCRQVAVQNSNDSGPGSLRQTIADACPEAEITIPASVTRINLASEIVIDKSLVINGAGADKLTISGANVARVFRTAADTTVSMSGMTIADGNPGPQQAAGGIANFGTLFLQNVVVTNNRSASGGGIYNFGKLYVRNSTVSNNSSSSNSGGIFNGSGDELIIVNSTIANNSANTIGGGIYNGGALTLVNVTVSGNRSDADGVADNTATEGGGIEAVGTETLVNTIVAGNFRGANSKPDDISGGTIDTAEHNLIGDANSAGGIAHGANNNIVGANGAGTLDIATVLNTALALSGGTTPSLSLVANSPALDKGKAAVNPLTSRMVYEDQRGAARPTDLPNIPNAVDGDGSDIGAFEGFETVLNAAADAYSVNEDEALAVAPRGVLANDGGSGTLVATLVAAPTNAASFSLNADGSFTYRPKANFNGADSFTYKIVSGAAESETATVQLTINAINDDPDAVDDQVTVAANSGATAINVTANDTTAPDAGETVILVDVSPAANGKVVKSGGVVTYTPAANFSGTDSFTYTVTDGNGGADTATVTITITSPNTCGTTLAPATLKQPYVSVPYLQTLAASPAGGYTYHVTAGALPPGLSLVNLRGVTSIAGVPTTPGTYTFTLRARRNGNHACQALKSYTVVIPATVVPLLECVQRNSSGGFTARLGYDNQTGAAVTIPVGANNLFTPGAPNRGQTSVFRAGRVTNAFSVNFNGQARDLALWMLRGPDKVLRPLSITTTKLGCSQ